MGNVSTAQVSTSKPNKKYNDILKEIHEISDNLLYFYKTRFLSKDFCDNIAVVLHSHLSELGLAHIQRIHNDITTTTPNTTLSVFLEYKIPTHNKLVVEGLKDKLIDYFKDGYKHTQDENIILRDIQKYISGQRGGGSNGILSQSDFEKYISKNKSVNNQNQNQNQKQEEFEEPIPQNVANKLRDINKDINAINKQNISKQNAQMNIPKQNTPNLNKQDTQTNSKQNTPNLNKQNTQINTKQNIQINTKQNTKQNNVEKEKMCKDIVAHYTTRINLISAILASLPSKDGKGGYCNSRIIALENGRFCLPSDYKQNKGQNIKQILRYIDNIEEFPCAEKSGIYRVLTDKEKTIFSKSRNKYNIFYIQFMEKLKADYVMSLDALLYVVKVLRTQKINNSELNALSKKTKEILDDMHHKCNANYLMAILSYIKSE